VNIFVLFLRLIDKRVRLVVVRPGKKLFFIYMFGKIFVVPGYLEVLQFVMPRPFERWLDVRIGDVVVEGGSALGEDTVRLAELAGEEGKIIAVEPNPFNLIFLRHNASYYRNVVVVSEAL